MIQTKTKGKYEETMFSPSAPRSDFFMPYLIVYFFKLDVRK